MAKTSSLGDATPAQIKEQARRQREAGERLKKKLAGGDDGSANRRQVASIAGSDGTLSKPEPNDPASKHAETPNPKKALADAAKGNETGKTETTAGKVRPAGTKKAGKSSGTRKSAGK
jgi:hypothetical protein